MFEPVKVALGPFMDGYFKSLAATTPQLRRYLNRPLKEAIAWAPTRMIDKVEEMFAKYLRVDNDRPTDPHDLPVIIIAMARDYAPTGRDYARQVADAKYVIIRGDEKERLFKLKTIAGDLRVQVAFFAREEPTCKSMAAQFLLYLDETFNRRFRATYRFAGIDTKWPVQIEAPDSPAMNIESGSKDLNILTVDLTLKVTVPLFIAPREGEPNDGKGIVGTDDPPGFPLVSDIKVDGYVNSGVDQNEHIYSKTVNVSEDSNG